MVSVGGRKAGSRQRRAQRAAIRVAGRPLSNTGRRRQPLGLLAFLCLVRQPALAFTPPHGPRCSRIVFRVRAVRRISSLKGYHARALLLHARLVRVASVGEGCGWCSRAGAKSLPVPRTRSSGSGAKGPDSTRRPKMLAELPVQALREVVGNGDSRSRQRTSQKLTGRVTALGFCSHAASVSCWKPALFCRHSTRSKKNLQELWPAFWSRWQ